MHTHPQERDSRCPSKELFQGILINIYDVSFEVDLMLLILKLNNKLIILGQLV